MQRSGRTTWAYTRSRRNRTPPPRRSCRSRQCSSSTNGTSVRVGTRQSAPGKLCTRQTVFTATWEGLGEDSERTRGHTAAFTFWFCLCRWSLALSLAFIVLYSTHTFIQTKEKAILHLNAVGILSPSFYFYDDHTLRIKERLND